MFALKRLSKKQKTIGSLLISILFLTAIFGIIAYRNGQIGMHADVLPPGSSIQNQASLSYTDGQNQTHSVQSNTVSVLITQSTDTTPPIITLTSPNAQSSLSNSVTISANATDNIGVSYVEFYRDSNVLLNSDSSSPYSYLWDTKTATNGSHTLHAKAYDTANNFSLSTPITVTVNNTTTSDTTAPTVQSFKINNGELLTKISNVTLSSQVTDNIVVSQMCFSLVNSPTCGSSWANYSSSTSWNLTPPDGIKTVYAWFKDSAGNISNPVNASIILDTLPPSGSILINNNTHKTSSSQVVLNIAANDLASGVDKMSLSNDNLTWTTWLPYQSTYNWDISNITYGGSNIEGTHYVYVQFQDKAGNASAHFKDSIIFNPRNLKNPISIYKIHPNARGIDSFNLRDEYFILRNNLTGPVNISSWYVKNARNSKYTIPTRILKPGKTIYIHSGRRRNTQTHVYMNRRTEFLRNRHDRLYLYDPDKHLLIRRAY